MKSKIDVIRTKDYVGALEFDTDSRQQFISTPKGRRARQKVPQCEVAFGLPK